MKIDKSSMLYWFPLIKNLDIPQPKTQIILLTKKELDTAYNEQISKSLMKRTETVISQNFKLPVFIRTDLSSAKHYWKKSCFYDGTNELRIHLWEVIEFNLCADVMGLPFKALVVREYIPMDSKFTAFRGNMPINPERRYFIDKGKVLCHHPYWIREAIMYPSIKNWEKTLEKVNRENKHEIEFLTDYAQKVAKALPGFWSVDFCKAKDGRWILIDCAIGERSWHPEDCEFYGTVKIDYMAGLVKKLKRDKNSK